MRRPLLVANWKMNGSRSMARELGTAIAAGATDLAAVDIAICPPFVFIGDVADVVRGSPVRLGAQDVSEHEGGAYTGEVSATMLRDYACTFAIVGHSERRAMFGDTNERVAQKFETASKLGLVPILCVGETLAERRRGETTAVVAGQLEPVFALPDADTLLANAVIAYEPVWAIGTGETATPEQAAEVHAFIRSRLAGRSPALAERLRILYGGSVKPENARSLFALADVDGGLVGGASLKAGDFLAICAAAA